MFKKVIGFENYTVNELGVVRHGDKVLKPSLQPSGYIKVYLYKDGKRYTKYLHGKIIRTFDTLSQAAEYVGDKSHGANIIRSINSKHKIAYGYTWRYV